MKYKKRITPPADRAIISAGRKEKDKYILDIAPDGTKKLIKNGVHQIDEEIQSHANLCDVKQIIKRFSLAGEQEKLAAHGGEFVDLTCFPKNLAEFYDVLNRGRDIYDNLSDDVRKDFPDYDAFLSNFGSIESINSFLENYVRKPNQTVEKDGTDDAAES